MMTRDPVEVTPAISTPIAPTTAIQHKDVRPANKDDTCLKFFGEGTYFQGIGPVYGSLVFCWRPVR
jgi:hypothetical protein